MENFESSLEYDTIKAIRSGDAMPLPQFLEESQEARQAFSEALLESENLRTSLQLLTPEERIALIRVINDVLDSTESGQSFVSSTIEGLVFGVLSTATLGGVYTTVSADNRLSLIQGLCGTVVALSLLVSKVYSSVKQTSERKVIKNEIIKILGA